MHFQKPAKTHHSLPLIFLQEMTRHLRKIFPKFSTTVQEQMRSETSINYFHAQTSIVIEEVNLDAEWRNIFGSDQSLPIFLLSANSI